jgi:hypothetical protein
VDSASDGRAVGGEVSEIVQMPALRVEGLAPHLSWAEVMRHSGYASVASLPQDVADNVARLAAAFEVVRTEFGDPLRVVSGLRSPEANRRCGGAKTSRHMTGEALDLHPYDKGRLPELYDIIDHFQATGRIVKGGLCVYRRGTYSAPSAFRFVHMDVRGRRARWSKSVDGRWTSARKDKLDA